MMFEKSAGTCAPSSALIAQAVTSNNQSEPQRRFCPGNDAKYVDIGTIEKWLAENNYIERRYMIDGYPLKWPSGWPRTDRLKRRASAFKTTPGAAIMGLEEEIARLSGILPVFSSNLPLKPNGRPYAGSRGEGLDDPGVCVYFTLNGKPMAMPCDNWENVFDNFWAIKKTIEAMRGIERWGAKSMINAIFTGFRALPQPVSGWRHVFGFDAGFNGGISIVETRFRELAKQRHPDLGGTSEDMARLNEAMESARRELIEG